MGDGGGDDPKLVMLLREQNGLLRESLSRQDRSEVRMETMLADIGEIKSSMKEGRYGERIKVLEIDRDNQKFWTRCIGGASISALVVALFELLRHGGKA